ncbi:MAG: presenilin family intramembrane aspartyl protease PSH [Candidatus Thermoplasmatota archaeon]
MDETAAAVATTKTPEEPFPIGWPEYRATAVLLAAFLATFALAALFAAPFKAAGLQVFEDPENPTNSIGYILLLILFTLVILYIAKKGKKWLIQLIILAAVAGTLYYVVQPVLLVELGVDAGIANAAGIAVGLLAALALYKHPEWYVIDSVGILVAAASAALLGISLGLVPALILLAGLAIYDFIAVYKTKHMLSLADTVIELRLPVLLVIPKRLPYRFRAEASKFKEAKPENRGEREAMFMGLGDLVMPTILVVSALQFAEPGWGAVPALGAVVGTLVGFAVLMGSVLQGRPQAGLPLLNGGAIVGFLTGLYAATGSLRFW